MPSQAATVADYLAQLPEDRKPVMTALYDKLKAALPAGFEPTMSYGMICFSVPHSRYPAGYHCDPKQALPFLSIASQKSHMAVYHMGLYASPELMDWFTKAWAEKSGGLKLDMGKSCIRFKKPEQVPLELLAELAGKMTVEEWIALYEKLYRRG